MTEKSRDRFWLLAFACALALGFALRLVWVLDMDYKADEHYMFEASQKVGVTEPWPALGMVSGAGARNPALSIWIFVALARVFGLSDPTGLARAVQAMNLLALALGAVFAWRTVGRSELREREPWLWALALNAVNPMAMVIQRKIWAQSVLPLFSIATIACWWWLDRAVGAFFLGVLGALVGQIHLSGFFYFAALLAFAFLYRRKDWKWGYTAAGAVLGSLPMLPWIRYVLEGKRTASGYEWYNLKTLHFYDTWLLDVTGLDMKTSIRSHFGEFLREPLFGRGGSGGGSPTWLGGLVFGLCAVTGGLLLLRGLGLWIRHWRRSGLARAVVARDRTAMLCQAIFVGMGLLMTLMPIPMQTHYLVIAFPLAGVWLARLALTTEGRVPVGRALLGAAALSQALMSILFLLYVHRHGGAPNGDYGEAYRVQARARQLSPDQFKEDNR